MEAIKVKKIKKYSRFYYVVSRILFVLAIFVIWFFVISQVNFKRNCTNNLSGWCEEYEGNWVRVYEDGTREQISYPVKQVEKPGKDIIIETILPKSLKDDAIFCMLIGRNTWFYIDGELRGTYLETDNPIPGGMAKNRIVQVELSSEDAGKTLRIVRNDKNNNLISITEAYLGNSYGIYNTFYIKNGTQMNISILLVVLSCLSLLTIMALSLIYKSINSVIYLCAGIFLVGIWLVLDNILFQYMFGTFFIDGIMTYLVVMLAPFFFIYYLNKEQKGRYAKLYSILNFILLINFVVFSVLHFFEIANFSDAMIFMNIVLSGVITGIAYTLVHDFTIHKIGEYKYIAIGLLSLAICGIIEIIFLNVNKNGNFDGIFILIGLYVLLIMAVVHMVKQTEQIKIKAIDAMRANKFKSSFLANMSHEIRTPLNAIMGFNEMISMEDVNDSVKEYAYNIKNAGSNLLGIINDILDFSKIESGKMELVVKEFDLATIINDVVTSTEIWAKEKNLELKILVDRKLPCKLMGDEKRIRQILINLLSNAVKYTDKGYVKFFISGKENNSKIDLCMSVADTGIGIKAEDKDKLFKKFERITNNKYIEGTGLGLSITGQLVGMMGGTISVESEYKKGSTFTVNISLPIVDNEKIGDYKSRIEKILDKNSHKIIKAENAKILVVDDNNMNLMVAKGLLRNTDMIVETCSSGREMLELIEKNYYDVILLDHMMPEMDGIEALHKAMELENNMCRTTPIIAMTANAIKGVREDYLKEGFADYLSKPVSADVLIETISRHLKTNLISEKVEIKENVELPELNEFDLKYAMSIVGDKKMLIELLIDYGNYIYNLEDKLNNALDDIKQYEILVHSIKSSSANVGALTVARLARLLEIAAKKNDKDRISTLNPVLIDEIKTHYEILKPILPEKTIGTKEYSANNIINILNDLKENLKVFDYTEAVENAGKLNEYELEDAVRDYVKKIQFLIDDFEPEQAIENIEKLEQLIEG